MTGITARRSVVIEIEVPKLHRNPTKRQTQLQRNPSKRATNATTVRQHTVPDTLVNTIEPTHHPLPTTTTHLSSDLTIVEQESLPTPPIIHPTTTRSQTPLPQSSAHTFPIDTNRLHKCFIVLHSITIQYSFSIVQTRWVRRTCLRWNTSRASRVGSLPLPPPPPPPPPQPPTPPAPPTPPKIMTPHCVADPVRTHPTTDRVRMDRWTRNGYLEGRIEAEGGDVRIWVVRMGGGWGCAHVQ